MLSCLLLNPYDAMSAGSFSLHTAMVNLCLLRDTCCCCMHVYHMMMPVILNDDKLRALMACSTLSTCLHGMHRQCATGYPCGMCSDFLAVTSLQQIICDSCIWPHPTSHLPAYAKVNMLRATVSWTGYVIDSWRYWSYTTRLHNVSSVLLLILL